MIKRSFLLAVLLFVIPPSVSAHAFGALYNLPVPFWLYLYGAVAVLVVSFLLFGYFLNTKPSLGYPSVKSITLSRLLNNSIFINIAKVISVLLFVLTIVSGLFGVDAAYLNFNMTFFWIFCVTGLTILSGFMGNIYALLNPWKIIIDFYQKLAGPVIPYIEYPKRAGYYPALIIFIVLIWLELIGQTTPFTLSIILLQYTIINFFGYFLVGNNWFKYCEFFSVFFRLISLVSVLERAGNTVRIRPPFAGILTTKATHFSQIYFVIFMLSSTAFDGFRETTIAIRLYWGYFDSFFRSIFGENAYLYFQTIGLLFSIFVFLALFMISIFITKIVTRTRIKISELALGFIFTLIPIAFAYNIAHYYTLIFTEGPRIFELIQDPFGWGWRIVDPSYLPSSQILNADFVWHSQVLIILIGHIAGVYLSHVISLQLFNRKLAMLSQLPLLILMVIYTIIGLWILSQPLGS